VIGQEITPPSFWEWVGDHPHDILHFLWIHALMVVIAVAIGLLIAFPLSILAYRRPRSYPPLVWATGFLYTIPSIALFILLIPATGISYVSVEIGLVIYTLLILLRNFVVGLRSVDPDVREAALGMGYSKRQILWRVDVPLALPAIIAGIRLATVSTVALVTVGFVIGHGALGQLINDGITTLYLPPVWVGVLLCIALALVADSLILAVGRVLTPWSKSRVRAQPVRGEVRAGIPRVPLNPE
jgi:osmoprotectant transport system permease protein